MWMGMTDADDSMTAIKVEIFRAIGSIDIIALSSDGFYFVKTIYRK